VAAAFGLKITTAGSVLIVQKNSPHCIADGIAFDRRQHVDGGRLTAA
jgi:hypothetical protein